MMVRVVRIVTAFAVMALGAVALVQGLGIVRFGIAQASDQPQALRAWDSSTGLSFTARELSLTAVTNADDEVNLLKRRDEQAGMLSARPLSSKYWLMFSEMRLLTKEPENKVAEAVELSELTGSHEGYLMFPRGMYGVVHWENLPQDLKWQIATDLVETTSPLTDPQKAALQKALAKKTDPVRQDIKTVLAAKGFSEKNLAAIGL